MVFKLQLIYSTVRTYCSAIKKATGLQFYYVISDPKVAENIFIRNSLNAIVLKLKVILLMMEVTEKSKSSYYSLSY